MTVFEYDNLPETLHDSAVLDKDLTQYAADLINTAKSAGYVVAEETRVVHVFERKGYLSTDNFPGPRNKSYASDNDDLVVQVTVRITNPKGISSVMMLANIIKERKITAARVLLEEELAALEIHKTSTEALIEEKKKKLTELGVQEDT